MGTRSERAELVTAFEQARAAGDVDAMAAAALSLAARQQFGTQLGRDPALLHEVYELSSGPARIRLAVALTRSWVYGSEPGRAVRFAAEAAELARATGDPTLLAEALDAQLLVNWGPDDLAERLRITAELEDVTAHLADTEARMSSHLWRLTTALETLDATGARRQLRALDKLAEESATERTRFFAASRNAMFALLTGDLVLAEALTAEAVEAGAAAGEPDTEALRHELTAYRARQVGDAAALAEQAAEFEAFGTAQGVTSIAAEAAQLWLAAGDVARARDLLDRLGPLGAIPRDVDWLLNICILTEVAAGTDAGEVSAAGMDLLSPYAGRAVVNAGGVTFVGVVDDFLRLACTGLGRSDEASRWATSAAAQYRRLGARWWLDRLSKAGGRVLAPVVVAYLCAGEDGRWRVGAGIEPIFVNEYKGFRYLRLLLERPGAEVESSELVAAVAGHSGTRVQDGNLGEVVDRRALAEYRRRLAVLDEELGEARDWSDSSRAAALAAERSMLLDEVSAATGLSGRLRRTGSTAERARIAVKKSLTAAIQQIERADPYTGRLLRDTIRTGTACRYEPDPARPIEWILR